MTNAGVPEGLILGPLLFPVYINDLLEGLTWVLHLFAVDASLFSVAFDVKKSARDMNNNLKKISEYVNQWKTSLDPYTLI